MSPDPVEILLVEDNPVEVRLSEEALTESGVAAHVSVVGDGVEAAAFLRREGKYADAPRPNIILLDLALPKKGGLELLSEIKADSELRQIPVVVLTSSANPARSASHERPKMSSAPLTVPVMSTLRDAVSMRASPSHGNAAGFQLRVSTPGGSSSV